MKTVDEINEKIRKGDVHVVTAEEMKEIVEELGPERAAEEVDVVTTGTFGAMCSSGAFLNFGHSDPPIKMKRVWLNDVEAYAGLAAVDAYIGATRLSETREGYGGAHVIEDLVSGRSVELRAVGYGTDCYPRTEIRTSITIHDLNQAIMFNPRNAYQRYYAATNSSDRAIHTYLGTLLPNYGNVIYCGAGELSPLCNDPEYEAIGIGTRVLLCGGIGYIAWHGTQHSPQQKFGTLALIGDMKQMSRNFMRAAVFHRYGVSLYVGVGVPIPILNERIAKNTGVRDDEIKTLILDYSGGRRDRKAVKEVSYAELKSGRVEIDGREVPASSLSSIYMARKIAEELKALIEKGEFLLTNPVERIPKHMEFRPMKEVREPLVREIMKTEFPWIEEGSSLQDAARAIVKSGVTHIPVIGKDGGLCGIVTAWDISKAVVSGEKDLHKLMTRKVITSSPDEPVSVAAKKIERYNVSALPVVENGKVIGIVASDDISRLVMRK